MSDSSGSDSKNQVKPALNFFACLGLAPSLVLDKDTLTQHFHDRQRALHPDRWTKSNHSPLEQLAAILLSANLNQAYQCLKMPEPRALHWLHLHGLDAKNQMTSKGERINLPPERLMQHLEWREKTQVRITSTTSNTQTSSLSENLRDELRTAHQQAWQIFVAQAQAWQGAQSSVPTSPTTAHTTNTQPQEDQEDDQKECQERVVLLCFQDFCFFNRLCSSLDLTSSNLI